MLLVLLVLVLLLLVRPWLERARVVLLLLLLLLLLRIAECGPGSSACGAARTSWRLDLHPFAVDLGRWRHGRATRRHAVSATVGLLLI